MVLCDTSTKQHPGNIERSNAAGWRPVQFFDSMKSYTSLNSDLRERLMEAINLYKVHSSNVEEQAEVFIERVIDIDQRCKRMTGRGIENCDFLEVGPGQRLKYLKYFALRNAAVGLDLDEIFDRLTLKAVVKMLKTNGPGRAAKTVLRKCMGFDSAFERAVVRRLGISRLPSPKVVQMNAEQMKFPDDSFDFVFSCSTFEHLPQPDVVIREINRVLRTHGRAYVTLHLFTCDSGCHDPRIFANRREKIPLWAHLRPNHKDQVCPNAYLNEIRLADWERIFQKEIPNVEFDYIMDPAIDRRETIRQLQGMGELSEFTGDELMTVELVAVWSKIDTSGEKSLRVS